MRKITRKFVSVETAFGKNGDINEDTVKSCKKLLKCLGASESDINDRVNHHAFIVIIAPS